MTGDPSSQSLRSRSVDEYGSGDRVGRFEIVRLLGRGSMGAVYLARDPVIGRDVAVKTLFADVTVSPAELHLLRRRFLNEARSAGALRHPGIVTVYDVIEHGNGRIAIAMEYVQGTTLRARLDQADPLPLKAVLAILTSVAETLDYAHRQGVVHRDVKPANVILTAEGSVKIADFGIASLRGDDLARELNSLGTPNYLAPERILGRPADARADVYALGVILYEMLTRHMPFQGATMSELARSVVRDRFVDPLAVRPDLPREVIGVLEKALAKSPDDRYQSASDLVGALARSVAVLDAMSDTVPTPKVEELDLEESDLPAPREDGSTRAADPTAMGPERPFWLVRLPKSAVVPVAAGLLVAAAVAASIAALEAREETARRQESAAADAARRQRVDALLAEARFLAELGAGAAAERALAQAERAAPEPAIVMRARREVRSTVRARREAEVRAEVRANFEDAQAAFERRDIGETASALSALLEIDPGHEGGRALASALAAVRLAAFSRQQRPRAAEVVVEEEPPTAGEELESAFQPFQPVPRPPPASEFGTLRIDFQSQTPKGVLTVYANGNQLFSRGFRFTEKKGLLRRKQTGGGFDERTHLPAGRVSLRVYLALPGRVAQSRQLDVELAGASLRTLRVRVSEGGDLVVDFY